MAAAPPSHPARRHGRATSSVAAALLAASSAAFAQVGGGRPVPAAEGGEADTAAAPRAPSIVVKVTGFRNRSGRLQCSLFAGGEGFPDHPDSAMALQRAPIAEDGTATVVFGGVPPGEYAVGCMHDENENGKFDQGLFGIPLEGYGFSNNHTHALRAPDWDESRFTLGAGEARVVPITLKY